MARTDTTPFRDPRNAVGLLTDVLDLALTGPTLTGGLFTVPREVKQKPPALYKFDPDEAISPVIASRDLGREFAKAPRRVFNGYRRKGTADLYQRVKAAYEELPSDMWLYGDSKRELHTTLRSLAERGLKIVIASMEDVAHWQRFPSEEGHGWHRWWHDHVSSALRLGVCQNDIANAECGWRFRDLTERSHRGRNMRAAFEAAWLAGQYKFARSLVE
jgi:hypothetical protein